VDVSLLPALAMAALGFAAGCVTTAAGTGGGLILTLGLGITLGPVAALTISAPALLLGHIHRAVALRKSVESRTAKIVSGMAIPGAVVGGVALVSLPESAVWWILLAGVVVAALEATGMLSLRVGRWLTWPGSFSIGFLSSAGGVGGVLLPPVMLAAGLSGVAFVATASVGAVAVQVARVGTYGATGLLDATTLASSAFVALGLVLGNAVGRKVLERLQPHHQKNLARSVLLLAIILAAYGTATH
jgi:uncharacterized membrane protein YfcA